MKKIRKRAGKVRDMDVLTANALTLNSQGEQDCQVVFLEHLGAQRDAHAKGLNKVIDKAGDSLRQKLKRASKRAEDLFRQATTNPEKSETASSTAARAIQLFADLPHPIRLNKKNLHAYRLKVKELRNVLQLSDRPTNAEFFRILGEVKDAIGDWHDWEELANIATTVLDHRGCRLAGRMKATAESKYKHALSLTNELRKMHLKSKAKGRANRGGGATLTEFLA
jgi:CHAD domain-containing protein